MIQLVSIKHILSIKYKVTSAYRGYRVDVQKGPLGFVSSRAAHHSREIEIVAREEGYLAQDSLLTKATQLLSFPCLYFEWEKRKFLFVQYEKLLAVCKLYFLVCPRICVNS